MKFTVGTLLNDGRGRFWRYEAGDLLVPGPVLTVHAETFAEALDVAYGVGNREAKDADGREWPHDVRSLSSGDVLVDMTALPTTAYSVESFGFKPVPAEAVVGSLFGAPSDHGGRSLVVTVRTGLG